jgi:hypothetical protein
MLDTILTKLSGKSGYQWNLGVGGSDGTLKKYPGKNRKPKTGYLGTYTTVFNSLSFTEHVSSLLFSPQPDSHRLT